MLDFKGLFDNFATETAKVFSHNRSQTVGASEAFGCIRKTWFSKRGAEFGYKQDADFEQSWGATKRGDLIEAHFVVPGLRSQLQKQIPSAELLFAGDDQATLVLGHNSATPDGLITGLPRNALASYGIPDIESDCVVLEIKSIDPRVSLREEKSQHNGQTQVQMGIIRDLGKYKPNYAVILYIDASFYDNIKVFVVKFDPDTWEAAKKRANNVFTISEAARLAPEGKFDNTCTYCPFKAACSSVNVNSVPPDTKKKVEIKTDEEIAALVAAYREAQDAQKKAEYQFEVAKENIKEALRERNTRRAHGEDFKVSWFTVAGRRTLDKEAMAADGIDLEKYEKEGQGYDQLKISFD